MFIFTRVQRQLGADQEEFREQLNHLAIGKFTLQDWESWKTRYLHNLPPEERARFERDATRACAFKKVSSSIVIVRLRRLGHFSKQQYS